MYKRQITGYRDHGHMLAYGIDPKVIMAELTGRAAGISKGKGGSMHMFSVEHGFYGGHGIVGDKAGILSSIAISRTPPARRCKAPLHPAPELLQHISQLRQRSP